MLEDFYEKQLFGVDDEAEIEIDLEELKKILSKEKKSGKFLKQKRFYMAS